jgi:putative flippase GtrA
MALIDAGLYSRVRHLLPELLKFGVVGGIGAVIDLGGAAVLHRHGVNPLEAKAISTIIATVVTYLGSRYWTFKHRENQALGREVAVFIVLNVIGLLIAEAVIALVTYGLGLRSGIEYNAASVIGTGLATIFRYFAYRQWVFTAPAEQAAAGSATAPRTGPFPDYAPWELDPAFLAAEASTHAHPAHAHAPAAHATTHVSAAASAAADAPTAPAPVYSSWEDDTETSSWEADQGSWEAEQGSWEPVAENRQPWVERQVTLPIERLDQPLLAAQSAAAPGHASGAPDLGPVDPAAGPRGRHRRQ